jgi:hypothetical protein
MARGGSKRGRGKRGREASRRRSSRVDPSLYDPSSKSDPTSPRLDGDTKLDPDSIATDVPVESDGFGYVVPAGDYVVVEAYRRQYGAVALLCRELKSGRMFHAFRDEGDPGPFHTDVGSYG